LKEFTEQLLHYLFLGLFDRFSLFWSPDDPVGQICINFRHEGVPAPFLIPLSPILIILSILSGLFRNSSRRERQVRQVAYGIAESSLRSPRALRETTVHSEC